MYWNVLVLCGLAVLGGTLGRLNIALRKTVDQSSTLNYNEYLWTADLAVDNVTEYTGDGCRCCASTGYEYPAKGPWWEVDLGSVVRVGKVKVFGRSDKAYEQLYGFKMFVSETTPYNYSSAPYVYINNVTSEEYLANQGVTDVLFGDIPIRYVALALHTPRYKRADVLMVVCEVQVFITCNDFHFEPDCELCHCDGAPCDKVSGVCPGGCTAGWKGQRCDQVCDRMTFGDNCSKTCHCYFDTCDPVTGLCSSGGCVMGYHGDKCDIVCDNKTYGKDCFTYCGHCYNGEQCNSVDGQCKRCAPGYLGNLCNQTCPRSSYGDNCSFTCGNCYGNIACDHVTGTCQSCASGYQGELCVKQCTSGTYGPDCQYKCGKCKNDDPCDIFTGHCPGGCSPGYQGNDCLDDCLHWTYGENCSMTCGHCYGNITCDNVTGTCQACAPGYQGDLCVTQKVCGSNTYSIECVPCGHCYQGDACDAVTGYCPRGCQTTHEGDHCAVPKTSKSQVHPESVLIGVGIGLVGLTMVAGIAFKIRRALRKRQTVGQDAALESPCHALYEIETHFPDCNDDHLYCGVVEYGSGVVPVQ